MHKEKKYFSKHQQPLIETPNLVENQILSYKRLIEQDIKKILDEFSSIQDYSAKKFLLKFLGFELSKPKHDEHYAKANKASYEASLRVTVQLENKTLGTTKEQELFMADFPLMTDHGTFVINGIERVVVSQLTRSPGMFFTANETKGKQYFGVKIIPARGVWVEIESASDGAMYVRIDRKRKFSITILLRVFGLKKDADILKQFKNSFALPYIKTSLEKDTAKNQNESFIEIYKRLRNGDLATAENAKEFIDIIFSKERYDLSEVGRFKFNKRFDLSIDEKALKDVTLSLNDLTLAISHIAELNDNLDAVPDDIDHLGSRRVKFVGEMMLQKIRVGLSQMKRNIQDKMSTVDVALANPVQLISPRPLQARIKEFFATNQLSQLMNQENVLAEIEQLRILSALGPGGLTRERAGLDVRDVHTSHYGRLCPIHTPEGPNIGLILHLSVFARVNDFGMIETPYARVKNGKVTNEIVYLDALEEEKYKITHAAVGLDKQTGQIKSDRVMVRYMTKVSLTNKEDINFIDVATNQPFSLATSMIPFLEHNAAARALMGSSMQKQATPCVTPEMPLVATGMESVVARDTGRLVIAQSDGEVVQVDAKKITVKNKKGKSEIYKLVNFVRTSNFTTFHQRPIVDLGQKVKRGDVLADTSSTDGGQVALGQNVFVAFMSWGGQNYEDAIIISERLVKNNIFTTVHTDEFVVNVRDTKLGPEITTHDIPNVGEAKLKDLDEEGIVRIGAIVGPGDILVGKITPKGEAELTPEERLLRSIFGEKARDVKDTSRRMEHGKRGRVVGIKVFSSEKGDALDAGLLKRVYVEVAQLRNVSIGDKLAGRHGNKGVISIILPEEEMPYMENGVPVDVILTPLGVPSRMNLGQILEMSLGLAAHTLNYQAIVPIFLGATIPEIKQELVKAKFPENGKVKLYDGRTGEAFEQDIAIGCMYMLKLHHMVEDKVHMRSIGPYSLITQQPLGGKAQGGGQRFGEMEVWALEGYGAAHILREMITIKSDDITGRSATFDAIIKGDPICQPHIPAAFNVLLNNLKGLALDVQLLKRTDSDNTNKK
ncbi:DNA-directed RNA polymerase subunit beta [Patescibacteria group bacterium]|nr:DNA-directed RNA polymerase subunit beta [Patescibacteria group bacterium]MBU1730632.1 DNA-directed RNA polymerase subunit beta [Patescibacteria group bacterium]MBU1956650.1 DNA-directed RNA polymerase subunit beta [Patescibacteria group bacterium]